MTTFFPARRRGFACRLVLATSMAACPFATSAQDTEAPPAARPASAGSSAPGARVATPVPKHAPKARRKAKPAARDDTDADTFVYGHRADVMAYAQQVAAERGLDPGWVVDQLARARYRPSVARLVMPPPVDKPKNWAAYRARFLDPQHLQAGEAWWTGHAQELDAAEARYGVPPELVAAILGVETFWGRITGNYRVLDALATLAFDFPIGRSDRSDFYRSELRAYLTWCALEGRDADSVRGSYAGAIGWPQFMPSSILRYAADFDDDGRVDLASGGADVIGSVANFLFQQGWQRAVPVRFDVLPPIDATARAQLLGPDIVPSFTAAEMTALGAELPQAAHDYAGKLALVRLENGREPASYVAGTFNFYVVTRYNWSAYYAMAVTELASALRLRHAGTQASTTDRPPQP
ncbi:MAG TPA: lytic murein transglycosylase B [Burkholderiaceae bacterium]|jgi:membrane-bound lytic murein transglycosylase B|nr:lytic murein transglycosylase B [Burkholderiaceae bacterium]